MLMNGETLFIHVPKVGGMSVTAWLLNNLDGQIFLSVPETARDHARGTLEFDDIEPRLNFLPGGRHERISPALTKCTKWQIGKPKRIFVLVRPAYDLIRSYFQYCQKPKIAARMSKKVKLAGDLKLARAGDFPDFARNCTILGKNPERMLGYYNCADPTIALDIIPLEHASEYLARQFGAHENYGRLKMPRRNASKEKMDFDPVAQEIIARRFSELQSIYDQAVASWSSGLTE
ncbi:MAG: hypothetical protein HKN36_04150 [Hellea sp.]|nr:hypothetical protein [Hellea sp.]